MKKKFKIFLLTFIFCEIGGFAFAQNKYFVLFKDKANSNFSVARPKEFLSDRSINRRTKQKISVTERDLPPNQSYVNEIAKLGKIWYKSRWFNGVLVETTEENLAKIKNLSFYKGLEGNGDITKKRISNDNQFFTALNKFENVSILDNGLSQPQLALIGADKMHEKGFKGEGMWIGVLDSGFLNASNLGFFKSLFEEKRILGTYDFVKKEVSVYEDDSHGTNVLSCMAAFTDNQIVGTAPKASYLLLRTEDVFTETKLEEVNWLIGAEYADSLGVDVINTSLGYTTFDSPEQNYTVKNLDGKTAIITRAADFASETGILVVCSAGNDGAGGWQKIGTPADAFNVISVGAVTAASSQTNPIRASFSSYGGKVFNRVKPELVAQGQGTVLGSTNGSVGTSNGTSFSSPLLAGMAAAFWQAYPQFTNKEIRDILIKSGSQYDKPDSLVGYGLPNFERAVKIAETYNVLANEKEEVNQILVYPNPFEIDKPLNINILNTGIEKEVKIKLSDITGCEIFNFNSTEQKILIPSTKFKNLQGSYFLNIQSENINSTKKIIIN